MSAKWRRNRKRQKRFNIFRAFGKTKDKGTPQMFRTRTAKAKSQGRPYGLKIPKTYQEKKMKEPEPLIDVLEEKDGIIIVAEFAGFKRENLKLNVKNQRLTLSAEALNRKYRKSLNLPNRVIPDTIRTTYKNGVLQIHLKKAIEQEKTIDKLAG